MERRAEPRRRVASLAANYFEGTTAASFVVRDINSKGAFLFDHVKWLPGTVVTLTLVVTGSPIYSRPLSTVELQTKIVRRAQNGLGVQFVLLSNEAKQGLVDFLKNIPEDQYIS